ncbi:MAG: HD domain-containing protein [Deltaproteobacteria bacterium]
METERLEKQIRFLLETDKLKQIFRQNYLADGSRKENDAEHSWHLALMAVLLAEHINNKEADKFKVVKMVLIHDLVEVYAGDTYCYGDTDKAEKLKAEQEAAKRIFGMLPEDQAEEFKLLWKEFEDCETPEAKYAALLDRFQPLLLNHSSEGKSWIEHKVESQKVIDRNKRVGESSKAIAEYTQKVIEDSVKKGYLA